MKQSKTTISLTSLLVFLLVHVPLCIKGEELPSATDGVITVTVTATGQFASRYAEATVPTYADASDEALWLKVVGPLSGPDINVVKRFVYRSNSKIRKLDLGEAELTGEGQYNTGTSTSQYSLLDMEADVVGEQMFYNINNLTDIVLPSSLKRIDKEAFASCGNLETVNATSSALTTIDEEAFSNCYELTTIALNSSGLTTIGKKAFNYCNHNLTSFPMPTTVTSIGEEAFCNCEKLATITLPEGIMVIPKKAFYYCYSLTSINIPTAVTEIDDQAFYDCSFTSIDASSPNLTRIGKNAFYYCNDMTSITLNTTANSSLTTIDYQAFRLCNELTSIEIPATVTTLGEEVFTGCGKLASVTLPPSLTTLPKGLFSGCNLTTVELPANLTAIPDYLFSGCSNLTTVTGISHITSIGKWAFRGCSNLTTLTLPSSLTTIDEHAFYQSSKSACNLVIPTSVETIGERAFYECKATLSLAQPASLRVLGNGAFEDAPNLAEAVLPNLESLGIRVFKCSYQATSHLTKAVLPNSLTELPEATFDGCKKLTDFTLPTSLTTIGDYALYNCKLLPAIDIPASVTTLGKAPFYGCETIESIAVPEGVTKLEYSTFNNCKALTTISLPSTLTSIDYQAFYECESLPGITLPNAVKTIGYSAFGYCKKLEEIVLPASVETIGYSMFQQCESLERVTLPANLAAVPSSVFYDCPKLKHVTLPEGADISNATSLFYDCTLLETITMPTSGVTSIPKQFCYNCEKLQSFNIPDGCTTIGESAFYRCRALPSITIPSSVATIKESAFAGCYSLTSLVLPQVETLGESAFSSCKGLVSVTLPETTLTAIPNYAFYGCRELLSIDIPASVGSIGHQAFYECTKLATVTLHDGLQSIGQYAFRFCSALQQITIPNTVTTISNDAFGYCSALQSITLPVNASFTQVPSYMCQYCTSLTSVSLPQSVTKIGSSAFEHCEKLATINLHDNITEIGSFALAYTAITDLRIPPLVTKVSYIAEHCPGLTIVTVPEGVTELEGGFSYCNNLRLLYLPSTLTKVSSYAWNCDNLTEVHIKSLNCTATNNLAPLGYSTMTLFVPKGTLGHYNTETNGRFCGGWKAIVEEDYTFTGLPDAEWQVLSQLPTQTGGPQWARPWTLGATAAESEVPQGVSVRDGHIVGIALPQNNLQGELPYQLFTLPNLETLDLSGNHLTGLLATIYNKVSAKQTTLKELYLADNELTGNVYHICEKVPNLTLLNVANNHIRDAYPLLPSTIEHLNIGGQDLTDVVTGFTFNHLRTLIENPGIEVLPSIMFYNHSTTESGRYYSDGIAFSLADALTSPEWHAYCGTTYYKVNYMSTNSGASGNTYWYQHPTGQTIYAWGGNSFTYISNVSNKRSYFAMTFDFEPGDVDFNLQVNLSDLQTIINFAKDDNNYRSSLFNFTAGNLKADDDVINVQDVVRHINLLLDMAIVPSWARRAENPVAPVASETTEATLTLCDGRLVLHCDEPVGALELVVSGEPQWQSALSAFSRMSRNERTIFYSLFGDELPAGDNLLATFAVPAASPAGSAPAAVPAAVPAASPAGITPAILDAFIVRPDGSRIPLAINNSEATGIANHSLPFGEVGGALHDLQGRRLKGEPRQNGIYVDGNGRKVIKH